MKLISGLMAKIRLLRWRKKLKKDSGFNVRVLDPVAFLAGLEREQVPYVVLRWYEELPDVLARRTPDDVDILVAHGSLAAIAAAVPLWNFGAKARKVKFDIYSDSGRSGLSYRKMPYYPPSRARHLLDNRVRDPRGWYRIAPADYMPALVYHLAYHKRQASGMRMMPTDGDETRLPAKKDYVARLVAEAGHEQARMPRLDCLVDAHLWLRSQGWSMPLDLIRRWPDQDPWLEALYRLERAELRNDPRAAQVDPDLVVLVTRQESVEHGCQDDIVQCLQERTEGLVVHPLDPAQVNALWWWARGGNWLASKQYRASEPVLMIQCRCEGGVAQVKAEIRKALSERHGKQNWLHGTDDLDETLYYLALTQWGYPVHEPALELKA